MRVGFIGLGLQGAPMAQRIAEAGFDLVVWARRPDVRAEWAQRGITVAETADGLAKLCDLVGVCVTGDADVTEVTNSLLVSLRPGSTIIIHSTISADTAIRLGELAAARRIQVLDAPVSGGPDAAAAGKLMVMAGGDTDIYQQALPIMQTYGDPVMHLGQLGNGLHAKIINNLVFILNLAAAEHAARLGESLGMKRADLQGVLLRASGRSMACEVLERTLQDHAGHVASLFRKDIGLADDLARQSGVPSAEFLRVGEILCERLGARVGIAEVG